MDRCNFMRGKVDSFTACLEREWIADLEKDYLVISGWIKFVDNFIGRCSGNDAP